MSFGSGGGTFPIDDGRTLDAIDLLAERGYKVDWQMYWLTALVAGGPEWQPEWFQSKLAAEKGKSVPLFVVYYIPHLFFPNFDDHSNPLPYDVALSPANEATYLAYIDRFGDFAATLTGDVYITLEPEYNIVSVLQVSFFSFFFFDETQLSSRLSLGTRLSWPTLSLVYARKLPEFLR